MNISKSFFKFVTQEISTFESKHKEFKKDANKKALELFEKKYNWIKKKKYPSLENILSWNSTKSNFNDDDLEMITNYLCSKVTGIFKHTQTQKTFLCNLRILDNATLNDKFTIALTKNNLKASEQWVSRLLKDLKTRYDNLKDIILVCSSEYNDLNGNATHCKKISDIITAYTRVKNFKILFLCSNDVRIRDILTFLDSYDGLKKELKLPIEIIHDEAHNEKDGIPSKREMIEHIILNPFVSTYIPVSASEEPIYDEKSVLWKKQNIKRYEIDYTKFSNTRSTDNDYCSISDANTVLFDELQSDRFFNQYDISEFDTSTFLESLPENFYKKYSDEDKKADIEKRRKLEFCTFMKFEKEACNLGMNVLDNYYFCKKTNKKLILPHEFNLHIFTTPKRIVLTIHLMKYAVRKDYRPICIGLYGGKDIHVKYRDREGVIRKFKYFNEEELELNEKIYGILCHLKQRKEDINRPVLVFGNEQQTGESITFVNYKYGTVRSHTILPSTTLTCEQCYQIYSRGNYMIHKFVEQNPKFTKPTKYIIGNKQYIDYAIYYEKQNDKRIDEFEREEKIITNPIINYVPEKDKVDNSNISIPVSIMITDIESDLYQNLRSILEKSKRSDEERDSIMNILKKMMSKNEIDIIDKSQKFNFDFTLVTVRTYRKGNDASNYRFSSYDANFKNGESYINNPKEIKKGECEILFALDKYEHDGFTNQKSKVWLSYRY